MLGESLFLDSAAAPWLGTLLATIAFHVGPAPLFAVSLRQVRDDFNASQVKMLGETRYVLYLLRHGRPSHDRRFKLRSVADVKRRGRWTAVASVKRYEAHARVQQEEALLSAATRRAAQLAV